MNNKNIEKKYLFQPVRGAIAPSPPMDPPLINGGPEHLFSGL